jgi:hypothetical protein
VYGYKSKRPHQLLSDGETNLFYIVEAHKDVTDLYEQKPLLDFELAIEIAIDLGIRYPEDRDRNAVVMTTDLVVEKIDCNGDTYYKAYSFKYSSDLDPAKKSSRKRKRLLEKLQIEKTYWENLGVKYAVVTEKYAPKAKARNLCMARRSNEYLNQIKDVYDDFCSHFLTQAEKQKFTPANSLIRSTNRDFGLSDEQALWSIYYGIWIDKIAIDHAYELNIGLPLRLRRDFSC